MKVFTSRIPDVLIFEQSVHADDRGYFTETWRQSIFDEQGIDVTFVQDNQSNSSRGTLRGLHYQLNHPQGKLARVVSGEVFDVAVDLRKSSGHFGQWIGVLLSAENKKQLWIPAGFAHGFYVLGIWHKRIMSCFISAPSTTIQKTNVAYFGMTKQLPSIGHCLIQTRRFQIKIRTLRGF